MFSCRGKPDRADNRRRIHWIQLDGVLSFPARRISLIFSFVYTYTTTLTKTVTFEILRNSHISNALILPYKPMDIAINTFLFLRYIYKPNIENTPHIISFLYTVTRSLVISFPMLHVAYTTSNTLVKRLNVELSPLNGNDAMKMTLGFCSADELPSMMKHTPDKQCRALLLGLGADPLLPAMKKKAFLHVLQTMLAHGGKGQAQISSDLDEPGRKLWKAALRDLEADGCGEEEEDENEEGSEVGSETEDEEYDDEDGFVCTSFDTIYPGLSACKKALTTMRHNYESIVALEAEIRERYVQDPIRQHAVGVVAACKFGNVSIAEERYDNLQKLVLQQGEDSYRDGHERNAAKTELELLKQAEEKKKSSEASIGFTSLSKRRKT